MLSDEHIFNRYKTLTNQRRAAAQAGERRSLNGLGRLRMQVDEYAYHYWGQRLGTYKCWKDPQFLHEFERDNPEVRVKCHGTKMQVGYKNDAPLSVPIGTSMPRYRKRYA